MKYFHKESRNIANCQNQTWVVPAPSIPHLLTAEGGQNPQDKMFHTLSYIRLRCSSNSMFYSAVQCVRGEDLVDCVMIGADLSLPSLHCTATPQPAFLQQCTVSRHFCVVWYSLV